MEDRSQNMGNVEEVVEEIGSLANNAKSVIAALQKKLNAGFNSAVDASKKTGRQVETYVEENPWYFVLIALGIGIATGLLIQKNRNK